MYSVGTMMFNSKNPLPSHFQIEAAALARKVGLGRPVAWKAAVTHLAVLAIFGIYLPWLKGVEFMDAALPTIYTCLGPLFAAPALVQLLREGGSTWPVTSARITAASIYGEGVTLLLLVLGIGTVLVTHRQAYLFLPDPVLLGEALLLGLGLTVTFTALSAWITFQFSTRMAMTVLRVLFLLLFALFFLRSWWLPVIAGRSAIVALGLAAGVLFFVKRRTQV